MVASKNRYFVAFAVVVVAAGAYAALPGDRPERVEAAAGTPAVAVVVQPARITEISEPFEVGGAVRARQVAAVVSRVTGEIREVRVAPGDRVRAGQRLVLLDSREMASGEARAKASLAASRHAVALARAERQAASAGLELARATYRRVDELHSRKSATPHELDQAVAALRTAEARLESAEARTLEAEAQAEAATAGADSARIVLSYTSVTAPFDGLITRKHVDAGNTASPGMPLVDIEDVGGFRLEVFVDESRARLVSIGQAAEVVLDGVPLVAIDGRVSEVARGVEPGSHSFLVKIDLPGEGGLRTGMFGRARFAGPSHQALVVPASSLVRHGQLASVFVVGQDGRARMRLVNAASPEGDFVEIRAGIVEGEQVVVSPPPGLLDGSRVSPAPGGAAVTAEGKDSDDAR